MEKATYIIVLLICIFILLPYFIKAFLLILEGTIFLFDCVFDYFRKESNFDSRLDKNKNKLY